MTVHKWLVSWHNNRGNFLLGLAFAAGLVMCIVWYFDMVPDIRLVPHTTSTAATQITRQDKNQLVVTIRGPELPTAMLEAEAYFAGEVELYSPVGSLRDRSPPLLSRRFELRDNRPVAIVFEIPVTGEYAVMAYFDLNENGVLDLDENHVPAEPFRLSRSPTAQENVLDLYHAAVRVRPAATTLVDFDFRGRP